MLSQRGLEVLIVCLANRRLGEEVNARLITSTPATSNAAQLLLNAIEPSEEEALKEYLVVALANQKAGLELAKKINGMVTVLQAKADGNEIPLVPAVAAQFDGQVAGMTTDVVIDADVAGLAGNVTLTADSVADIDGLIAAWNLANVGNELTLASGDGSQIPTADIVLSGGLDMGGSDIDALIAAWNLANVGNELTLASGDGSQVPQADIELTGGLDAIPASDGNLAPAKLAMGSELMSDETYEILVVALANRSVAAEFKTAYNAMIGYVQAIS